MKSIKFCYSEEKSNIDYEEFYFNGGRFLKKIDKGNCEFNFGGQTQGRILFDTESDKVYSCSYGSVFSSSHYASNIIHRFVLKWI